MAGFNTIHGIREHMSLEHSSNYLLVGARRTSKLNDESADKIQLVHVGESQENSLHNLAKCSMPNALNSMNPMELIPSQQLVSLEKLNIEFQNLKTILSGSVPRILGATSFDIIKYDKYEKLIPLNIQYKCITDEVVNDVNDIESYIDRSKDFDSTKTCEESFFGAVQSFLRHRCQKHSAHPIVFLQIEQRAQFRVHKIVRCNFQCQRCHATFITRSELIRHFNNTHPNHWIAAIILMESQVIESSEPKSSSVQSVDFFYSSALACVQSECMRMIGSRTQAIEHHNQHHHHDTMDNINEFEFAVGEKIVKNAPQEIAAYVREINEIHQMHLFECHHCKKLFESLAKIEQHSMGGQCTEDGVELELRFSMNKLFRCREDNVIQTFAGMKIHYENKHSGKQCTPVNVLFPNVYCGLCDYNYKKNNDLNSHYDEKHARGGDSYSDAILKSMKLDKIDTNQCKYTLGCCTNEEQNQLDSIVDHLMKCERRFVCEQCPNCKFSSAISFVLHCMEHDTNANGVKIVGNLQNIKTFLSLLQNMTILMPNGLVLAMAEIVNTAFGEELSVQISRIAQDEWKREKDELLPLTVVRTQLQIVYSAQNSILFFMNIFRFTVK